MASLPTEAPAVVGRLGVGAVFRTVLVVAVGQWAGDELSAGTSATCSHTGCSSWLGPFPWAAS